MRHFPDESKEIVKMLSPLSFRLTIWSDFATVSINQTNYIYPSLLTLLHSQHAIYHIGLFNDSAKYDGQFSSVLWPFHNLFHTFLGKLQILRPGYTYKI